MSTHDGNLSPEPTQAKRSVLKRVIRTVFILLFVGIVALEVWEATRTPLRGSNTPTQHALPKRVLRARAFYVSPSGNDRARGTSPSTAWRTLRRVDRAAFKPGSKILLQAGATFTGPLVLDRATHGTPQRPITVQSYGRGRATIQAPKGGGIGIYDTAGIRLADLRIVGPGSQGPPGSGIVAVSNLHGDVKLRFLQIDSVDISGFREYGVLVDSKNGTSGFSRVRISHVVAHDNVLGGIVVTGKFVSKSNEYAHRDVHIGWCRAYGNPGDPNVSEHTGDGIVVADVDGATIERSVAYDNGRLSSGQHGGPVGIWAWDANHVLIQHNDSYSNHVAGPDDGGGFDLDGGVTNSLVQYNHSHDNDGPGYQALQFAYARPHRHNIIRYNSSQNDARRNGDGAIWLTAGVKDLAAYGNKVVISPRDQGTVSAVAVTALPGLFGISPVTTGIDVYDNRLQSRGGAPLVTVTGVHPGLVFAKNRYASAGAPLRIDWRGAVYHSVAAWQAATGQEPHDGLSSGITRGRHSLVPAWYTNSAVSQSARRRAGSSLMTAWLLIVGGLLFAAAAVGTLLWRRLKRRAQIATKSDDGGESSSGTISSLKGKDTGSQLWGIVLPRVLPYAKPYRKLLTASIITTLFAAAATLAAPWPIALVIDDVLAPHGQATGHIGHNVARHTAHQAPSSSGLLGGIAHSVVGSGRYALLAFAIASIFVLTLIEGASGLLTTFLDTKLKLKMVLDLMGDMFQHFQRLGLGFHDKSRKGALMKRVNESPAALGEFVGSAGPIVQSSLTLIGMLIVAAFIDWQLALAALLIIPLLYYQISLYTSRVIPQVRQAGMLEMKVMSTTLQAMQMLRLIVSFAREGFEHRRFRGQAQVANEKRMKVTIQQSFFSLAVSAATAIGTALVLGFGALHVIQGKTTVGQLVVLMTYITAIYKPLQDLTSTAGDLNQHLVNLSFAFDVLEEEPEVIEAPDATAIDRAVGRVEFDHVTFAYDGREQTVEDISFKAGPGQRVAIVGRTGHGKSTLASLLVRFYDPQQGRILVDDTDIRELTLRSLREQIALVLQEPLLLAGTIEENIRYGRLDATREEVIEAAKAADIHDFISRRRGGYDTELGERGPQLSGGERQRICIARAFLKDAPIVVLDEPTASIDAKTEAGIFDALDRLMAGRTCFVITHRLATIRDSNFIVLLRRGRVEAQGTHDELFERSQLYRQLCGGPRRARLAPADKIQPHQADVPPQNGNGHPADTAEPRPAAASSPHHSSRPRRSSGWPRWLVK